MNFFRSRAKKEGEEEKRTSEKENRSTLELSYQQQQQQQQQQQPPTISYYEELAYMDFDGKGGGLKLIANDSGYLKYYIWVFVRL
jgi:hypothetical protein